MTTRKEPPARKARPKKLAKASAKDELPVEYVLRVMRDGGAEVERRDAMAKTALPYLHAKPKAGDTRAEDEAEREKMEEASARLARRLARANATKR